MANTNQNSKKEKTKTKSKSIAKQLLILSIIPLCIVSFVISNISNTILKRTLVQDSESELRSTASTIRNTINNNLHSEISINSSGDLSIDSTDLKDSYSLLDNIKEDCGIDITIFANDTRKITTIKKDGERIVGTKASDEVIQNVLKDGNNYFDKSVSIEGTKYYGYYMPLKDESNKTIGMVFTGETTDYVNSKVMQNILIITIIAILLTLATLVLIARKSKQLAKSLTSISEFLVTLTNGDLTASLDKKYLDRNDEIGLIAKKSHSLRDSLKELIQKSSITSTLLCDYSNSLFDSAENCKSNASSVDSSMNEISNGAISQAENTQTASEKAISMADLIKNITDSVNNLNDSAENMSKSEKEASQIITDSENYNNVTIKAVDRIREQTQKTNDSIQKIKNTTKLITDIANQTNLLSLNASIEAARAGEAGRGFSVVAEEIQKLSEESNKSAKIIEDIISSLLVESSNSLEIMKDVDTAVNNQKTKINETKSKFEIVSNGITSNEENINLISTQTTKLLQIKDEILSIIENLSAISEENAASTEETTAAMDELSNIIKGIADSSIDLKGISEELINGISEYKLD